MRKPHTCLAITFALWLGLAACNSFSPRLSCPLVLRTNQILQFDVLQGQAQWLNKLERVFKVPRGDLTLVARSSTLPQTLEQTFTL